VANGEMYCDRATNGSPRDDNFAGDAECIEKRNHVITDKVNIERAAHFFRHARTAHIGTEYRKIFGQERHQSVPAVEAAAHFVEQHQGLRAIARTGVADCSAVDFDEGSFAHDLVSSGRIDQFAIHLFTGGLFNESRDSLGLREIHSVAALGLKHYSTCPFGHCALGIRWDPLVLGSDQVPAGLGSPRRFANCTGGTRYPPWYL